MTQIHIVVVDFYLSIIQYLSIYR